MGAPIRSSRPEGPITVAFLASGEGTTFSEVADRIRAGRLSARVGLVVVDREGVGAIERARERELPLEVLPSRGVDPEVWGGHLTERLEARSVELVLLLGFLTILPSSWVVRWDGRAVNLHPALLPQFGGRGMYGIRVHRAVLASGDRETGASVHLVSTDVDGGPVVGQSRIPVRTDDTAESLRARLHPVEVELVAETIRRFAVGELPLPYRASERPDPRGRGEALGPS
jgi:phosphoribosylglycinamide formyltransferase 1